MLQLNADLLELLEAEPENFQQVTGNQFQFNLSDSIKTQKDSDQFGDKKIAEGSSPIDKSRGITDSPKSRTLFSKPSLGEPDALAAPEAAATGEELEAMSAASPITSTAPATPLEVGARVVWSNASAHVAAWNPFTITDINGDTAMLDIYAHPVPLNELRRVE